MGVLETLKQLKVEPVQGVFPAAYVQRLLLGVRNSFDTPLPHLHTRPRTHKQTLTECMQQQQDWPSTEPRGVMEDMIHLVRDRHIVKVDAGSGPKSTLGLVVTGEDDNYLCVHVCVCQRNPH
jgi:hypothetical protein